jgi:hypothetical protein
VASWKTAKRLLSVATGLGLVILGSVGMFVSILAIIDPVGTKMADDNDPFGPPPTIERSLLMLLAFVVMAILGAWLSWRGGRKTRLAEAPPRGRW